MSFKSCVSRLHSIFTLRRNKKTKTRLVISAPFDFKKEDSSCILPGISGAELYMLREKAAASITGSAITSFSGSPDAYDGFDAFDTVTLAPSSIHDFHPSSSRNNSSGTISTPVVAVNHHHHHHHNHHRHLHANRSTSSFDRVPIRPSSARGNGNGNSNGNGSNHHLPLSMHRSMTAPHSSTGALLAATPTRRPSCCRRCKSARDIASYDAPPSSSSTTTVTARSTSPLGPRYGSSVAGPASLYTSVTLASTQPYAPTGLSCPSLSSVASAY